MSADAFPTVTPVSKVSVSKVDDETRSWGTRDFTTVPVGPNNFDFGVSEQLDDRTFCTESTLALATLPASEDAEHWVCGGDPRTNPVFRRL